MCSCQHSIVTKFGSGFDSKIGKTPLHFAAQWGNDKPIGFPLEQLETDAAAKDKEGQSPFDIAERVGGNEVRTTPRETGAGDNDGQRDT